MQGTGKLCNSGKNIKNQKSDLLISETIKLKGGFLNESTLYMFKKFDYSIVLHTSIQSDAPDNVYSSSGESFTALLELPAAGYTISKALRDVSR